MTQPEILKNLEISAGNVKNILYVTKFGYNGDIDTGTIPEDIWSNGGTYTGHSTETETIEVFSSDANDTSAGTGARTIRISGLKSSTSEEYETEDFILNGITAVTSVNTWYRVNSAYVLTAGSSGSNSGIITCRHTTTTANVFLTIPALKNQSLVAAYTIPFNRIGFIQLIDFNMVRASGAAGSSEISIRIRDTLGGGAYRSRFYSTISNYFPIREQFTNYINCPAGSDIKITLENTSDNDTSVSCTFGMIILQN